MVDHVVVHEARQESRQLAPAARAAVLGAAVLGAQDSRAPVRRDPVRPKLSNLDRDRPRTALVDLEDVHREGTRRVVVLP